MSDEIDVMAPVSGTIQEFSSYGHPLPVCPVCMEKGIEVRKGDILAYHEDECGVLHIRARKPTERSEPTNLKQWRLAALSVLGMSAVVFVPLYVANLDAVPRGYGVYVFAAVALAMLLVGSFLVAWRLDATERKAESITSR